MGESGGEAEDGIAGGGPLDPMEMQLRELLDERPRGVKGGLYGVELADLKGGPALLALDREAQAEAAGRLAARMVELGRDMARIWAANTNGFSLADQPGWEDASSSYHVGEIVLRDLLLRKPTLADGAVADLLRLAGRPEGCRSGRNPLPGIVSAVEARAAGGPLSEDLLGEIRAAVARLRVQADRPEARRAADRLTELIWDGGDACVEHGEAWSDLALADLAAMPEARRRAWSALLISCQLAGGGKPTAKWSKAVRPLIDAVGFDEFRGRLLRWLPAVDRPRTLPRVKEKPWKPDYHDLILPHHVDLLKGLAWCAGFVADRDLARALVALALSAYRKVPGRGPRLVSLGHAAVAGLGSMPGMDAVGQLALLKVKVKFIPAQKEVEKALDAAALREGLPREEVDELAVPAYGMDEVGLRREVLGDYVAELIVEGKDAALRWSKAADGKPLKSLPAAVKKDHADEVKDLQGAVKDIGKMLTAQRERVDGLFLRKKSWPLEIWRERYLEHPLVGTIARRLIWSFRADGETRDGIWLDGQLVDASDRPLEGLAPDTTVELWHPIGRPVEEISAWRDWLDRHRVRQPFKQAHREVYVLTDAERNTGTYSNRFAAHVLRQHQYHALCAARGWRDRMRLMVDDSYPPTSKDLPEWGLRAEFWVEGAGDTYGVDTLESGSYLYLSTDQVRFYEIGAAQREAHAVGGRGYSAAYNVADAEPVALDRVPPLVLSEVLRDADLFVGVASVGNDPTWADGGPGGRHADYWSNYSFGTLSANGQTRKAVLERLIPRLKIAPRCSFADRFLVVRGEIRTYKIHLGSGNILMEPNDQYLCIVAKQSVAEGGTGGVFLPFEGDNTLSIILSKALMLADDKKIKDPTITSQIGKGA